MAEGQPKGLVEIFKDYEARITELEATLHRIDLAACNVVNHYAECGNFGLPPLIDALRAALRKEPVNG